MCKEIRRSSARNTFIAESVYLVVIFVLGLAAGGEIVYFVLTFFLGLGPSGGIETEG